MKSGTRMATPCSESVSLPKLNQGEVHFLQPRAIRSRHVLGLSLRQLLCVARPGFEDALLLHFVQSSVDDDIHRRSEEISRVFDECIDIEVFARSDHGSTLRND